MTKRLIDQNSPNNSIQSNLSASVNANSISSSYHTDSKIKVDEDIYSMNDKKIISSVLELNDASTQAESLSTKELREFLLIMIQKKEESEKKAKSLAESFNELKANNDGLNEKLKNLEIEKSKNESNLQTKLQTLENENKLLKDQLKKYVSAVQLMRPNNQTQNPPIPSVNKTIQNDYSYEADQYEKKLIQVTSLT
jgi:predicted nuclease with TOPRIM domain